MPVIVTSLHITSVLFYLRTRGSVVAWRHYATSRKVAGSSPDGVDFFFQFTLSFQPHYGPGFDSASKRNENQESSWGVKGGRQVRLTILPPSVRRLSRENVAASTSHNPMGLHGLILIILIFICFLSIHTRSNKPIGYTRCVQVLRSPIFFLRTGSR
jgi:hypothetical protein